MQVDKAVEDCSAVINLREEILETILELEAMVLSYHMGVSPDLKGAKYDLLTIILAYLNQ